jgi:hypothetical protein
MQEQAYAGAANLQVPGQYQAGSELAGAGGLGSLGVAGQAGQAGNNYFSMATNPGAVNQFMNPYLQNALNPALEESRRQYGITGQQQQGAATQAGAFGGSREALMASENLRNMNTGMNQMIGTGYQNAYTDAQRNILQGSQLGLQGQQAALQGYGQGIQAAGALGQLGQSQLQGQQNILNMQNQFGAAQQAGEQAKINQAIQDYATKQQYPMMQLANMNNLLRGLPMQSATTQSYAPAASGAAQLGSIGAGAYGLAKLTGVAKAGGSTKDITNRASGGIASYAFGGSVTSQDNAEGIAQGLSSKQLEKVQPRTLPDYIRIPLLAQQVQEEQAAKQAIGAAQQGMEDQEPIKQQVLAQADDLGITKARSNLPTENMAGGGIVAFSQGGVNAPKFNYTPTDMDYSFLEELLKNTYNPVTKMPYTFEEKAAENKARQEAVGVKFGLYDEQRKELEGKKELPEGRSRLNEAMPFFELAERLAQAPKPGESKITPFASGLAGYGKAKGAIDEKEELRQEKIRSELNQLGLAQNQFNAGQFGISDAAYNQGLKDIRDLRVKQGEGINANKAAQNAAKAEAAKAEYKYGQDLTIAELEANAKIAAAKAGISPYTGDTNARVAIDSRNLQINKQIDDLNKAYGTSLTSISGKDPATLKGANLDTYNRYMADKKSIINSVRSQYDMSITDHLKRLGKSEKEINAILNAVEINPQAKPDSTAGAPGKKTKSGTSYEIVDESAN